MGGVESTRFHLYIIKGERGYSILRPGGPQAIEEKKVEDSTEGGGSLFSLRFENVKVWNQAQCPKTFHNDREKWPTSKVNRGNANIYNARGDLTIKKDRAHARTRQKERESDRTAQRESSKPKRPEAAEAKTNQSFFYWGLSGRMTNLEWSEMGHG